MSLTFGVNDYVNVGSGATLDNITTGSAIWWMYPTTLGNGRVLEKDVSPRRMRISTSATGMGCLVDRATADVVVDAAYANVSTVAINKWCCMAMVWNSAGANGDQHIYHGDLTTSLAEAAAYTSQSVGSGAVGDNSAATLYLGNLSSFNNGFPGRLGIFQLYNVALSLADLQDLQYKMGSEMKTGCVGWWKLGDNGTSTQVDLSGNGNDGTVTGTTVGGPVPLGLLSSLMLQGA